MQKAPVIQDILNRAAALPEPTELTEKLDRIEHAALQTIALTYAELKALRDTGTLVPGQYYRIIDYVTTTTQVGTRSAAHQFDVILRADSAGTLNEKAWAAHHQGDEYFANCNLAAWSLSYCLDNDTNRFQWADETMGKGVIYDLIDESGNHCRYDFKNIQFQRWEIERPGEDQYTEVADILEGYPVQGILPNGNDIQPDFARAGDAMWLYTFHWEEGDLSLLPEWCQDNDVAYSYGISNGGDDPTLMALGNVVFYSTNNTRHVWHNRIGAPAQGDTFLHEIAYLLIEGPSRQNVIGNCTNVHFRGAATLNCMPYISDTVVGSGALQNNFRVIDGSVIGDAFQNNWGGLINYSQVEGKVHNCHLKLQYCSVGAWCDNCVCDITDSSVGQHSSGCNLQGEAIRVGTLCEGCTVQGVDVVLPDHCMNFRVLNGPARLLGFRGMSIYQRYVGDQPVYVIHNAGGPREVSINLVVDGQSLHTGDIEWQANETRIINAPSDNDPTYAEIGWMEADRWGVMMGITV